MELSYSSPPNNLAIAPLYDLQNTVITNRVMFYIRRRRIMKPKNGGTDDVDGAKRVDYSGSSLFLPLLSPGCQLILFPGGMERYFWKIQDQVLLPTLLSAERWQLHQTHSKEEREGFSLSDKVGSK
ncbi:hypothetical protein MG293_017057 [Ovis ammon polii]|uniref:Uncharacterized protein n=1 Tax=Ovis ammon polii TaxID=230172 RepID=A0AAD4TUK6_OVIAM|nr:hypothetical protein MG293_017057 [Ovis ammon polii]